MGFMHTFSLYCIIKLFINLDFLNETQESEELDFLFTYAFQGWYTLLLIDAVICYIPVACSSLDA